MNDFFIQSDKRADARSRLFKKIVYEAQIASVFARFRQAGIEPILIKGWSIARFYPTDKPRQIGDIDLCVRGSDFSAARNLVKQTNFGRIEIDLHKNFKHLDVVPFDDLFAHSELISIADVPIRVLRHEDNLRVACVHWLTDGGARKDKLQDIYYLVQNRSANFDWERCLNAAGAKRRRWIVCVIALAHSELNLDVANTPIADDIASGNVFPQWFLPALHKEWNEPHKLGSLTASRADWRLFVKQLRRRFPPNPIQSSVLVEAAFDESARLPYQIKDVWRRCVASAKNYLRNSSRK